MIVLLTVETAVLLVLCILVAGLLRAYASVLQRLHRLDGGETPSAPEFRTADGVISPGTALTGNPRSGRSGSGQSRSGRSGSATGGQWGPAHDLAGVGLNGEIISVRTIGTDFDTLLVFLSSGCAGCGGFWQDLAHRREMSIIPDGRVLVVTKSPDAESVALLREMCPPGVDLLMSSQAWEDYDVPGSPFVVVVDGRSDQITGEGSGTSLTQLSGLIYQAVGDRRAATTDRPPSKPRPDADREVDVDRVLLAAGIGPGDRSLYASTTDGFVAPQPEPVTVTGHAFGVSG